MSMQLANPDQEFNQFRDTILELFRDFDSACKTRHGQVCHVEAGFEQVEHNVEPDQDTNCVGIGSKTEANLIEFTISQTACSTYVITHAGS